MVSGSSSPWTEEMADLLGRLRVSDTVEQLRRQMEELIERLAEAEQESDAGGSVDPRRPSPELNAEIENVGRKVDHASAMLTDLTDLLEAQAERIETLEDRLGGGPPDSDTSPQSRTASAEAGTGEGTVERYRRRLCELEDKLTALVADPSTLEPTTTSSASILPSGATLSGDGGAGPADAGKTTLAGETEGRSFPWARQLASIEEALRGLDNRFDRFSASVKAELRGFTDRLQAYEGRSDAKGRLIQELEERLLIMVEAGVSTGETEDLCPPSWPSQAVGAEAVVMADSGAGRRTVSHSGQPRAAGHTGALLAETVEDLSVEAIPMLPTPSVSTEKASATAPERLAELEKIVDREVRVRDDGVEGASAQEALRTVKQHPTVMVVDDAADARTILSMYLSRTGFQVVTAASAEDCLAKLRHHDVDAIVLDAALPGADGGHVCRVLREEPAYASKRATPVIVYTGYPEEYTRNLAAQWRADDYVVKGGNMLALMTSLIRHTKQSKTGEKKTA